MFRSTFRIKLWCMDTYRYMNITIRFTICTCLGSHRPMHSKASTIPKHFRDEPGLVPDLVAEIPVEPEVALCLLNVT